MYLCKNVCVHACMCVCMFFVTSHKAMCRKSEKGKHEKWTAFCLYYALKKPRAPRDLYSAPITGSSRPPGAFTFSGASWYDMTAPDPIELQLDKAYHTPGLPFGGPATLSCANLATAIHPTQELRTIVSMQNKAAMHGCMLARM